MDVKVYRLQKYENEKSKTKAFVDLLIDDELIVKGFKLIDGKEGVFLGNPRESNKQGRWFDTVRFKSIDEKKEVEKMVIAKYKEE